MKHLPKIGYFVYCLLFVAACAVPGAMLLRPAEDDGAEKRQLAEMPSLTDEEGHFNKEFPAGFTAYVSDHFGFRSALVEADSRLKAQVLQTSAEEDVIIGEDGWLYFTPTVSDFLGQATVSPLAIQNIVYDLEMMQTYAAEQGSDLIVAIVPNKNSIYPEHMPYRYVPSGAQNNYAQLSAAVAEAGDLHWCDLAGALRMEAAKGTQLYHKTDTHWNNTGALIGYDAVMTATDRRFTSFSGASYKVERSWKGDLQQMLFPGSEALDEQHTYNIAFSYSYLGRYRTSDDITIDTACEHGDGSLLMFRDSFGAAVIPYFSEQFASATYSRARPYPLYTLETAPADVTVLEIVERNIPWLCREAPKHAAPVADAVPESTGTIEATIVTEESGQFFHLCGTADLPADQAIAPVYYVTLTDPDGAAQTRIAYDCFECDLLGIETIGDNGWSLYFPSETLAPDTPYTVTLTADLGGSVLTCGLGTVTHTAE